MHSSTRTCGAVYLFLLCLLLTPTLLRAEPALWEIQGKENSVYLFGSIHVANESMYPLGDKIDAAFKRSQVLVVEVDEAKVDQVKLQQIMSSRGFYSGTETIKDHVSAETLRLLQKLLDDTGIPFVTVARMKPGIIALTLTIAKIVKMGYSPELGIDRYFMKQARGNKEVQQLETTEEQMELLLSFSDDNLLLKQTLVSLDKLPDMITDLTSAWKAGNLKHLEKTLLTDQLNEFPEFQPVFKRLIDDRNLTMSVKIQQMLNTGKNYFVVVGAAHLIGERGIVSLLRNSDLRVTPLYGNE